MLPEARSQDTRHAACACVVGAGWRRINMQGCSVITVCSFSLQVRVPRFSRRAPGAVGAGPAAPSSSRWQTVSDHAIEVRRLRKSYGGIERLHGVSFSVDYGEVFGFLGTNGAGKTTTIEILEGYRARDGGEVSVLGADPAHAGRGLAQPDRAGAPGIRAQPRLHGTGNGRDVRTVLQAADRSRRGQLPPLAWRIRRASASGACPAVRSAGWTWPSAWSAILRCCSWTSRPRGLTRRPAGACGR